MDLNEEAWNDVCAQLADRAKSDCGSSYDYCIELLSASIERKIAELPEHQRERALEIAVEEWEYATPQEREATMQSNLQIGCCRHGIRLGYCPAGCGS